MNLEQFPEKWREAISKLAADFSIQQPELFEESALQAPADLLVWTPETVTEDFADKLRWCANKTARFLFAVLPVETPEQGNDWRQILETQLGIREWFPFDGWIICTARRTTEWNMGAVVGAARPEERRQQLQHNLSTYKARVALPQIEHDTPLVLICYGPSIHETWRKAVSEAQFTGAHIATNSGAHDFMIKKGIVPKYHAEIDPRAERALFTEAPHPDIEYQVASVCHPDLTAKLAPFNMKLFHLNDGPESREIFDTEPDAVLTDGGACVSLRQLSLYYQMGYRSFSIYGFDCSFKENGMTWAGKHPGKQHKMQEARFPLIPGRVFKTSSPLLTYASQFFDHVRMLPDAKFYLQGDGLLQNWAIANAKQHAVQKENAA